ncbi:MAG: hypothetical protein JNL64_04680 [Blastocatellia bacterium]|nr:hypothetical protein [Blastocatellia bacterium]
MTTKRPQNSILVLATLGVYLGLVLVGTTFAQTSESKPDDYVIVLNKRPLKVYAVELGRSIKDGSVRLSSPVKFSLSADLVSDSGSSIIKLSNVILLAGATGDKSMKKAAIDGILAIGDSGWFGYLYKFDVRKVRIDFEQTDSSTTVRITGDQKDSSQARATASGIDAFTKVGRASTPDDATKKLLESVSATSSEATFSVTISLPSATFGKMVEDSIGSHPATVK